MSNLQTCWRQTVCRNRLQTASPQGIDAQASQGSVAPLTERSVETFSVGQFSSADRECCVTSFRQGGYTPCAAYAAIPCGLAVRKRF